MTRAKCRVPFLFMLSNFLCLTTYAGEQPKNCHPSIDHSLSQYLIGYGSLISEKSKRYTDPQAGYNIPVKLTGYERGWFLKGLPTGFSATFLGVRIKKNVKMYAAAFGLTDPNKIKAFDERESGYCRFLVKEEAIQILTQDKLPKGQYWIFVPQAEQVAEASEKYPITQNYVDLFVSGCIYLEKKYKLQGFAIGCVKTTTNWSKHWVNDRIFPRRPWTYEQNAVVIDKILHDEVPAYFNGIKIE